MSDMQQHRSDLSDFLASYRLSMAGIGLISAVTSLLGLASTVYMLEIYDRVLPSKSLPTLAGLTIILLGFLALQGVLEWVRGRILLLIGHHLDQHFGPRIYRAILALPLLALPSRPERRDDGLRPLRDLDQLRQFIGSPAPVALFDLPWVPVYVAIGFGFHAWIGLLIGLGALMLVSLTVISELLTKHPSEQANRALAQRNQWSEATRRNAEAIRAMGMTQALLHHWQTAADRHNRTQMKASVISGGLGALSRTLRLTLQSLMLGLGAYLAIGQQVSPGAIIACSVLLSRALQPLELLTGHWKPFLQARQAWTSLSRILALTPDTTAPMLLPAPCASLHAEMVSLTAPGQRRVLVQDVSFTLKGGQVLGIVGPSGSGKSTLIRALAGIWPLVRGTIRLDGAAIGQWSSEALGRHMGYLPQDIELFEGTIAQNIARFRPDAPTEAILDAARLADVHALIVQLPDGYDTRIGEGGSNLSAGQRQRIGLARAVFGQPFLVLLDEPNSNLDAAGEQALLKAIDHLRQRGSVVILVAHRPSVLAGADLILIMGEGRMQALGPKSAMLENLLPKAPPQLPPHLVGTGA